MDLTLINRKQFKGKYVDAILQGMEKAYGNLYPNNKITIKYGCAQECYSFSVYINGETFQKGDFPMVKDTLIYIDDFSNFAAIPLFSEISKDEYIKEYLDYSVDNYQQVRDAWQELKKEYEPQGVVFTDMKISQGSYRISFYHPEKSEKRRNYQYKAWDRNCTEPEFIPNEWYDGGHFNVQPISTATAKKIIASSRNGLKNLMKK